MASILRKTGFSLIALLLFAVLAEGLSYIAVRSFGMKEKMQHELEMLNPTNMLIRGQRVYFPNKPEIPVTYNDEGLRDWNMPQRKEANEYRMLILGDSTVMGYGVMQDEAFPSCIEERMKRQLAGIRVEVINGGVSGYSSTQSLALCKSLYKRYNIDNIMAYIMNSDQILVERPESPLSPRCQDLLKTGYGTSHALFLLHHGIQYLRYGPPTRREGIRSFRPRITLAKYKRNLRRLVALGQSQKIPVWFIIPLLPSDIEPNPQKLTRFLNTYGRLSRIPKDGDLQKILEEAAANELIANQSSETKVGGTNYYNLREEDIQRIVHEKLGRYPQQVDSTLNIVSHYRNIILSAEAYIGAMKEVGAQLGVPVLDLPAEVPAFVPSAKVEEVFIDEVHPTAYGHRLIAEVLIRHLTAACQPPALCEPAAQP